MCEIFHSFMFLRNVGPFFLLKTRIHGYKMPYKYIRNFSTSVQKGVSVQPNDMYKQHYQLFKKSQANWI
jgi:hypothetical protein